MYLHKSLQSDWQCVPDNPESRVAPALPAPVSDTGAPKKAVHHHASQPREARTSWARFSVLQQKESNTSGFEPAAT